MFCELTKGNLLNSSDIEYALQDIEAVIDASTSKPDDPRSIYEIDWDGKYYRKDIGFRVIK